MKLWQSGYDLDEEAERFTVGEDYLLDRRLIDADCIGTAAHARMLASIGVLSDDEASRIIEALASGPNTVKRLVKRLKKNQRIKTSIMDMVDGELSRITMVDIGEAAREGDKVALETIKEEGKLLGVWLGSMISVLDPEIIVIGGGVSLLGGLLFREIRSTIPSRTINIFAKKTPVVQAKLKRDVGIFGAASVLMR